MSGNRGIIEAHRKFKADALGWGVPEFGDFRKRLWPLRGTREWGEEDMLYVMTLQEEGADQALKKLFGQNTTARKVLGETAPYQEPMSKDELEQQLRHMINKCIQSGWTSGHFMAFIDYLDSSRTMSDLVAESTSAPTAPTEEPEKDHFAEMYRSAGKGYQRFVREMLARAADSLSKRVI